MKLSGKVWKFADGIGATDIVPTRYDKQGMSRQWKACAEHLFEDVAPGVAEQIAPGDILVAGTGFGAGHAHYYTAAIMGSIEAGLSGFLAEGIGGLFQRGSIDFGMPACVVPGVTALVAHGDALQVDLAIGRALNLSTGAALDFAPVSPLILDILAAGGSRNWAMRRVGALPEQVRRQDA
jgi:3-isopropylmalate/(R)-2-methylmalate dehydratase small subunit